MTDEGIVVGQFAGAFGVRGEVRLKSFCANPEDIAVYTPLTTEAGRVFRVVVITGATQGALIARIEGIDSKEAADALKGQRLLTGRTRLPHLPDDEYYHADLIGLAVVDAGGTALGDIKAVLNHGAGDLLEIARPGGDSVLLPFTQACVPTVDLAAGRVVVDPPDGVFAAPD